MTFLPFNVYIITVHLVSLNCIVNHPKGGLNHLWVKFDLAGNFEEQIKQNDQPWVIDFCAIGEGRQSNTVHAVIIVVIIITKPQSIPQIVHYFIKN